MNLFLSYAREDEDEAIAVGQELALAGASVFRDTESLTPGERFGAKIEHELNACDAFILLWSRHADRSAYILHELSAAMLANRRIFPCVLDDTPLNKLISHLHAPRVSDIRARGNVLEQLLSAIGLPVSHLLETAEQRGFDEAVRKYKEKIAEELGYVRVLGSKEVHAMKEAFMPIQLALEDGRFLLTKSSVHEVDSILELPLRRVVLLGGPGTGKSTILRYLAWKCASSGGSFLPFHVNVAELVKTKLPIERFLEGQIHGRLGRGIASAITSHHSAFDSKHLILLDGLDEVNENGYDCLSQLLAQFRNVYPDARLVVSSRLANFRPEDFADFTHYSLQPLTNKAIELYVFTVRGPQGQGLWRLISMDKNLLEMARTPFLLALLCTLPVDIPINARARTQIFSRCVGFLLGKEHWEQRSLGRPSIVPELAAIMEAALRSLAVRFFKLDAANSFSEDEVLFAIKTMGSRSGGRTPVEILNLIVKQTGLLQIVGGEIVFVHRSIWEYFVACGMKSEPAEKLLERANVIAWEEPIRLYVGLCEDDELEQFLPALWERNRGLALRAMAEQQQFPEVLLQKLVATLNRGDRLRLLLDLNENVSRLKDRRELRRTLLDTAAVIVRYEKDCEILYRLIVMLERFSDESFAEEVRALMESILDKKHARARRDRLTGLEKCPLSFVAVPGGLFEMGTDDPSRPDNERPRHCVRIDTLRIARCPITNGQYYFDFPFAIDRRDSRSNRLDEPVIAVTWYEAVMFAWWIGCDLPTEAEWEYACRSGAQDDMVLFDRSRIPEFAWYAENSLNRTHAVGEKKANSLGIHDMLGNVREWCLDWFEADYYSQSTKQACIDNPAGPKDGTHKVLRGGCFDWNAANLLPTYRNYNLPANSYFANGFRVVCREENVTT